ncbi:MAG: ribbon-helix-helix protein, CopG family [Phycisphaeraceae bacterium]|nr:ribbon-helix-helix protein, CopG family [Phycisphaeraceae bacterium]
MAADRPFDRATWLTAQRLAARYRLVIAPEQGVGYLGRTIELPYVMADGPTINACAEATLEATALAIATALEAGDHPPEPASEGKRELQLNIRLTSDEKSRLDEGARQAGFRNLSDFVRAAALRDASKHSD